MQARPSASHLDPGGACLLHREPWPHPQEPSIQTTQGNRLSCRDQEGRRGSEEAVPGPSVFPSGEPGKASRKQSSLSGKESAQGCIPKRLLGRPD